MSNGSWEKIYKENGEVQTEILNTVIEAVSLFKEKSYTSVLDLGCGTGRNTEFLAYNGFNITACDISETGVEITKTRMLEKGYLNVRFNIEDMFHLSYENELFDAVLCVWVQGHGTKLEIEKGVKEIYRVLKVGGTVVTDFVTIEDSTYGIGEEIDTNTFVGGRPGEEGIPHYYTTKEELKIMFMEFANVKLIDRTYEFTDDDRNIHSIVAVVVIAEK